MFGCIFSMQRSSASVVRRTLVCNIELFVLLPIASPPNHRPDNIDMRHREKSSGDAATAMASNIATAPAGDKTGEARGLIRIAVLDDYQLAASRFADWSPVLREADVHFFSDHLADTGQLIERLRSFDAVCLMRERSSLPKELIDALPRLKFISTTGSSNAALDLEHARRRGIVVSGTNSKGHGTPELIWTLLLALARNIPGQMDALRQGHWQTDIGADLNGRTLGIIGLGRVGSQIARIGKAFNMNIVVWSPNMTPERAAEHGAESVSKSALFSTADFIVVCIQLRPITVNLIGAAEIALMKSSAFLINTARGEIVDDAALIEALTERRIAGAGLDAFCTEPLPPGHPYRHMKNVIATPHIGYVTAAGYRQFFEDTVANIMAWLHGSPIREVTRHVVKR
ncbi:D-2-hydroxyacid dehydrogenase family protein [Herbaspirillum lusitanum]|uniref:D-2-hydroxyacid dehydrogenase family protein n=1 Tax=Herbaspirillum lusitanum TaxID=213312 RepID=A0ABW9ABR7_9BURK